MALGKDPCWSTGKLWGRWREKETDSSSIMNWLQPSGSYAPSTILWQQGAEELGMKEWSWAWGKRRGGGERRWCFNFSLFLTTSKGNKRNHFPQVESVLPAVVVDMQSFHLYLNPWSFLLCFVLWGQVREKLGVLLANKVYPVHF